MARESRKLEPKFIGPDVVRKCLGRDRYIIGTTDGFSGRPFESIYTSENMRPWRYSSPELDLDECDDNDLSPDETARNKDRAGRAATHHYVTTHRHTHAETKLGLKRDEGDIRVRTMVYTYGDHFYFAKKHLLFW